MTQSEWVARAAAEYGLRHSKLNMTAEQCYQAALATYHLALEYEQIDEGPEYCATEDMVAEA